MKRLLLVDGHGYAYRAFHAIRNLTAPDGRPTNAIFGFVKALDKLRASLKPTHVAVLWDGGLSEERVQDLPEYKAQRPEMPDALAEQLDGMDAYLKAAGLVSICEEGVEADDLIAVLCEGALATEMAVVIASADKDFLQLVSDRVGVVNPNDKTGKVWGVGEVIAKTGVHPKQIVDWLSLVGDSVDNIPGVEGVGVKTAAGLLREFGSIDDLYARLEQVKPERIRSRLSAAEKDVRRNQELVRLKTEIACPVKVAECVVGEPDHERLAGLFGRWGFRTMLAEVEEKLGGQQALL